MNSTTKTILLIDDDSAMHDLTRSFLEKVGYQLISAYHGQQGLAFMLKYKPDLILLDYAMPDMNGDQVYTKLTSDPDYQAVSRLPVILLTAKEIDASLKIKFFTGGIGAYLSKPFGLRELHNVIENVLLHSEIKIKNQKLQTDLQRTHDDLESLIDHAPIGILSINNQGIILKVNSYFFKILEQDVTDQFLGKNFSEIHPLKSDRLRSQIKATLQNGRAFQSEHVDFLSRSGRRRQIILTGVPLRDRNSQEITGAIILAQDDTRATQREYEMSLLSQISDFMQGTIDLNELLHLILTAVTAGCAMGFSRAMVFLINEEKGVLEGRMGVGPSSQQEALRIWKELARENISLPNFLEKYGRKPAKDHFNELVKRITVPLNWKNCIFIQALEQKRLFRLHRDQVQVGIAPELLDELKARDFAIVPLLARDTAIGILVADNQFSDQVIDDERINLLALFATQAGLAIERAATYARLDEEKNKLQQAYQELKNTQERFLHAERLAAIGEMAAQVAHEIRNPLVTIGGFARKIRKTAGEKGAKQLRAWSDIIAEEVNRLEKILTNMLDFSRLSKPQAELADINQIIEESCLLVNVKEDFSRKGINLVKDLDSSLPGTLMDSQQIKQVLLNLIENAVSFMPDGGTLTLSTKREDDTIRVTVADSGIGMSPDVLDRMFDPFFTTKANGIGLGLSICQQIIRSHGGRIDVKSESGKGTTFSLTLKIMTHEQELDAVRSKLNSV